MAVKDKKLTVPIELTINKDTYDKIASARKTDGNASITSMALGQMCSQFLDIYASGGITVSVDSLKQIEAIAGRSIDTEGQLVIEFQKSGRRDNGEYVIDVQVPAAIWPAVMEFANVSGGEPKELVRAVAVRAICDQLQFYINGQTWEALIFTTEEESRKLIELTGKKRITGSDIIALLERQVVAA